jgi:hypothetical protein
LNQLSADRIGTGPETRRHRLVDHGNRQCTVAIAIVEAAALHDAYFEGIKVPRRHGIPISVHAFRAVGTHIAGDAESA